ncbi:lysozyme [Tsukamurella sp. 8F]|uniref:LGFP repeat-containing protein n=1 Tax=unclassified Tsukamurella TaxID=2633480 RepID=UPI0023B99BCA|nr:MULTISPECIES: lysozyme [unclassified Tsukamurella]MDF0530761.1 lysozyme [Tsukamurella sp. 8J]MDF0587962.1 lysozyme [Tsukamurella sp. 8F]
MAAVTLVTAVTGTSLAVGDAGADRRVGGYFVKGSIERAYIATGGQRKWGNPTSPELAAQKGGRFQRFGSSSFYWHPWADNGTAHQVGGAIRDKWGKAGWEGGPLGYPVANERAIDVPPVAGWFSGLGAGAFNDFQGGSIYWSPGTGAHIVWGQIRNKWVMAGGYAGAGYGYPITDEYRVGKGFAQDFQRGSISWP